MKYIHPQGFILAWLKGTLRPLDLFKLNSYLDMFLNNTGVQNWATNRLRNGLWLGFLSVFFSQANSFSSTLYERVFLFIPRIHSSSGGVGLYSSGLILAWVVFRFICTPMLT